MSDAIIDIRTIVFCVVLIELFLSLIMVLYWRTGRGYPGFGIWALSIFIFAVVHICVMLRGIIPDLISIVGTNLFSVLGFLFAYEGAKRFCSHQPIRRSWYLLIPLNLIGVAYGYLIEDSVGLRTILLAIPLGILAFQTARAFYQSSDEKKDLFTWLIILNFIILSLIFLLRLIDYGTRIQERQLLESSVSNDILFGYSLFAAIISSLLFITINIDRLSRERDIQTAKAEKLAGKLDLAIKAAGAGVWEMNLTSRELSLDDQIYRWLGIDTTREDHPVPSLREVIFPEDYPLIMSRIQAVTHEDEEISAEYRIINSSGEIRYHLAHARSTRADAGSDLRLVGLSLDITPLRKTQAALQNAMKKLSMLSSITRHDILNCTTVIKLSVQLLQDECSDPTVQKRLHAINQAEDTITSLIRFTREYEDLGLHNPVWVDLSEILAKGSVTRLAGGVSLVIPEKGVRIYVDPMFEKVIYNLIDNSIRHGGHVQQISCSYRYAGADLQIIFADDGGGVPVAEKERIFEKGFGKNTGMGLFLCREILAITDGSIIEDGEPGRGARFVMTIRPGWYEDGRGVLNETSGPVMS